MDSREAMNDLQLELARPVSSKKRMKDLLGQKDNQFCADCNAPDPKWASSNIGVFLCLKCCGVHRSLGPEISKVLSVTLDEWSRDEIDAMMEVGGNSSANSIYEAYFPEGYTKPGPDASNEERAKYIRLKYEQQEFLKPSLRIVSTKQNLLPPTISEGIVDSCGSTSGSLHMEQMLPTISEGIVDSCGSTSGSQPMEQMLPTISEGIVDSCGSTSGSQHMEQMLPTISEGIVDSCGSTSGSQHMEQMLPTISEGIVDSCGSTSGSQHMEQMLEFIGKLKVKVIKGKNLAIRDIRTSDPYVVLKLGKQTVKTSIIKSNLNPVWNEELMLSVPQQFGILHMNVFDYDLFSSDDIMGDADIDLQPLIMSAMAFEDAKMFDDMQIGKYLKSNDNALVDDSIVNIIGGKVKQEMSIKLQNVECGEIDLELEWMPLPH